MKAVAFKLQQLLPVLLSFMLLACFSVIKSRPWGELPIKNKNLKIN